MPIKEIRRKAPHKHDTLLKSGALANKNVHFTLAWAVLCQLPALHAAGQSTLAPCLHFIVPRAPLDASEFVLWKSFSSTFRPLNQAPTAFSGCLHSDLTV